MERRPSKPYGPKYQDMIEAVALDHGCGIPAMACLHYICRKIDWQTGVMPHQLAHSTLARVIGASDRKTVIKATKQLRDAGVIGYASRGHNYDGGDANIYRFTVPAMVQNDPARQTGRPPPTRRADPPPQDGHLNPHPSLSRGEKAPASRGAAPADASGVCADGEQRLNGVTFTELLSKRGMTYGEARTIWNDWENEALRAAENG
ncbi:hypothetical protein [Yoonia sp.]|uniref:hypothetical protein n=1 Tax=Yoonia sp. TaxID=2212373 RepID=UPI002E083F66|nr:hypothetical protein [Yoonia sp.]